MPQFRLLPHLSAQFADRVLFWDSPAPESDCGLAPQVFHQVKISACLVCHPTDLGCRCPNAPLGPKNLKAAIPSGWEQDIAASSDPAFDLALDSHSAHKSSHWAVRSSLAAMELAAALNVHLEVSGEEQAAASCSGHSHHQPRAHLGRCTAADCSVHTCIC